ncbi:MAG: hypothetical protein FWD57_00160 [Polyangiaceae bacterium]|nr:hypothetical protein [Polyangiaceae bacterium]
MQDHTNLTNVNLVFATPRKLPAARDLAGRVVVLDIAFASNATKNGFERITLPLITDLGPRLAAWIDHHDHDEHSRYRDDPRFVLCNKADHGSCTEMITPQMVQSAGPIDTIVLHTDFDGLACAAKWVRGGAEPYQGCDNDAFAIDTRLGQPSAQADLIDRALRARPYDNALFGIVVRHLSHGLEDPSLWHPIRQAADELQAIETETRKLANSFVRIPPGVAFIDISKRRSKIDKTLILLIGQEREPIAMVVDRDTISIAARFDSGVNLLKLLGLSGGMPTRVAIPRSNLPAVCRGLGFDVADVEELLVM